jgi:hypothetical protein
MNILIPIPIGQFRGDRATGGNGLCELVAEYRGGRLRHQAGLEFFCPVQTRAVVGRDLRFR